MSRISEWLEILWSDFDEHDVESKLEAFHILKRESTREDMNDLLVALSSEKSDFWVRELLAEPIAELAGVDALEPLVIAFQKNFDDGHDNDTFSVTLMELAESDPVVCKNKLDERLQLDDPKLEPTITWLMEFCC